MSKPFSNLTQIYEKNLTEIVQLACQFLLICSLLIFFSLKKVVLLFLFSIQMNDFRDFDRWIYLGCLSICLILLFYQWFRRWRTKAIQIKQLRRGKELENDARPFLVKKGFQILGEQVEIIHDYEVDGHPESSTIVVDYLVKKRSKVYIVEVKSGVSATSIQNGATRRQILEYDFVMKNDGVILLDMEHQQMHRVRFFPKASAARIRWFYVLLLLSFVGIWLPFVNVKLIVSLLLLIILVFYKKIIM